MAKDTRSRIIRVAEEIFEKNLTRRWELGRLLKLQDVHIQLYISILKRKRIYYMQ